ncbi:substrate-binding domain-containing protein [Streptomyces sp. NPDC005931]|uniref:substrate-binding domain-containing protein n=1 Tax=Streptomyces sp. NPDC005931 TaxID=3364737 RepID=UPI0036800161
MADYQAALRELGEALTELKRRRGAPSYDRIRSRGVSLFGESSALSKASMSLMFAGQSGPNSLDRLLWLVRTLLSYDGGAETDPPGRQDPELEPWLDRWSTLEACRTARRRQTSLPETERPKAAAAPDPSSLQNLPETPGPSATDRELRRQGRPADTPSQATHVGISEGASHDDTAQEPGPARPPEPTPEPRHRPRWWRRKRMAGAAVGLLVLVAAAGVVGLNGDDAPAPEPPDAKLPACTGQVTETLRIASSTDKSAVLKELARRYGKRRSHGQCVQVAVDSIDSGTAMQTLARGWMKTDGPQPDVWSPASRIWLPIARQRAKDKALDRLPATAGPSMATSPLTIAMPEPMARALGWPTKRIGWKDLASFAGRPDFWKDHGHPEWGAFKLGKTNPEYSTSGLNATVAAFFTKTGTSAEMSAKHLMDTQNRKRVRDIENATVHYGDTTLTFLANLRRADDSNQSTSYISAVTVEETAVIAYNKGYPCGSDSVEPGCERKKPPHTKLVAFYPNDGTLYSDHPYIPLNGLRTAQEAVAEDFRAYLAGTHAQERFTALGFRIDPAKATAQITQHNGAQPGAAPEQLAAPAPDVLDKLLVTWRELRKPANVLILMDTSGSMNQGTGNHPDRLPEEPSKLDLVKDAHGPLLDGFTDQDRVGLWSFSDSRKVHQAPSPMGATTGAGKTHRDDLEAGIQRLKPEGATALYDVIDDAVRELRRDYDPGAINAVVVLTDGRNEPKDTPPPLETLLGRIGDPDEPAVRVFTIAYSSTADEKATKGRTPLQEIAALTHARAYNARDPKTISKVLTNVISNF